MTNEEYAQREYNRQHAGRVVGKAVHPGALDRLFELYPDVKIDVRHDVELYYTGRHMDDLSQDARRTTRVTFWLTGRRGSTERYVFADAKCHPNDNWDRRAGIKLAFDRALAAARKTHRQERWEAAQMSQHLISPRPASRLRRSTTAF